MKVTDQSLLDQMRINDLETARRKELLGFSAEDVALLVACRPLVEREMDRIVAEFYQQQTAIDEISLLIGDADTLQRLHAAQRYYIRDLFHGFYDSDYINNRLRIGIVHKRIGVEPKLYLSAINTLWEILSMVLKTHLAADRRLDGTLAALHKLLMFDVTLVFDTYIRSMVAEVEMARGWLEQHAASLERKVLERTREIEELSKKDGLTGLYTQRALWELLRREVARCKRQMEPLSVLYLDVDHFKAINDTQGHARGDEILKRVGSAILQISREIDVCCRYGGDEFCVILPNCTLDSARTTAKRLVEALAVGGPEDVVQISVGIAQTGPETFLEPERLVSAADKKMYESKGHEGSYVSG